MIGIVIVWLVFSVVALLVWRMFSKDKKFELAQDERFYKDRKEISDYYTKRREFDDELKRQETLNWYKFSNIPESTKRAYGWDE